MTITAFPLQSAGITFGEATFYDLLDDLLGTGVVTGLSVIQNPGGADMSVTVQAGRAVVAVTSGGKRVFKNSANSNSGVPGLLNSSEWIATFTAAHGTHPRIDRVVAQVQDNLVDGSGQNRGMFRVVAGTATAGATLSNLTGAAAVPDGCEHVAYVLVDAGATTITNAKILNTTARASVGDGVAPLPVPEVLRYYFAGVNLSGTTVLTGSSRTWTQDLLSGGDRVGWDATNKRVYAKTAGLYRVTWAPQFEAGPTTTWGDDLLEFVSSMYLNGSTILHRAEISNTVNTPSGESTAFEDSGFVSLVLSLAANDYIELRASATLSSAVAHTAAVSNHSFVELEYVGQTA